MKEYIESKQTVELIREIADRMRDPDRVRDAMLNPSNSNPSPLFIRPEWEELSTSAGYPGMLPLYSELDRLHPNEGWDETAHQYVLKIKEVIELNGLNQISLFDGSAGICFYIQLASRGSTRYQKLIKTLNQQLSKRVETTLLSTLRSNMKSMKTGPSFLFNLVYGITGIGIYLLKNQQTENFAYLLGEILDLLVLLTYPSVIDGKEVPGWCYLHPNQTMETFHYDLGVGYGISGVLAFLSIALQKGVFTKGQEAAVEKIANWLMERFSFNDGIVALNNRFDGEQILDYSPPKANWCHGLIGVSRSLYLAGQALRNEKIKAFAAKTYTDFLSGEGSELFPLSPNLSFGTSGFLLTTHAMAKDTGSPFLKDKVSILKEHLLKSYQPEHLFGFRDVEPTKGGGHVEIDRAGLLYGSAGILLTLLSLETDARDWSSPLLIDA